MKGWALVYAVLIGILIGLSLRPSPVEAQGNRQVQMFIQGTNGPVPAVGSTAGVLTVSAP